MSSCFITGELLRRSTRNVHFFELRLAFEFAPGRRQCAPLFIAHFGIAQLHLFQRMNDDGGDDQAREPLVVRRDHDPWGMFAGRVADHVLIVLLIVVPEAALAHVGGGELPVLFRLVEPREEAALLLFLAHVQEELANRDSVPRERSAQRRRCLRSAPSIFCR